MTKNKITALFLALMLISSMAVLSVNATSEQFDTMEEAAGGKNILKFPTYITGGEGFSDTESSPSLLDYEDEDTKYCTDQLPYYAEWQYDKDYVVERILLRTSNDSEGSPRRMGDGWTLAGSNDGQTWTVIYTGREDDVENVNFTYFYMDITGNTESYQYYRLNAEEAGSAEDQDRNLIQLSAIVLCVNESVEVPTKAAYVYKEKILKLGEGTTVIQSTDFDSGKYNETNAADGDHNVRPDEEVQTSFCGADYIGREGVSGDDATCIGWTAAEEWVQYTVNVLRDGTYQIDAWLASDNDPVGGVEIFYNDVSVGSAESTKNGWQNYSKFTVGEVEMTAGSQVIKVLFPSGGVNLHDLEFTKTAEPETTAPETDEPAAEDATSADEDGDTTATTESTTTDEESNNTVIILIVIAAVVVVVVVVVIVAVSKKKK